MLATADDLVALGGLVVLTLGILAAIYNHLLLASFNNSLALSRRVPVRLANYLFIVLLALIVNLCLRSVGVLLINALLIVPAATGVNVCRNLRQLFWFTICFCCSSACGAVGRAGSWARCASCRPRCWASPAPSLLPSVGYFVRRCGRPRIAVAKTPAVSRQYTAGRAASDAAVNPRRTRLRRMT